MRTTAEADRFDAEVALGRHAEVLPELEATVERRPLDERARAQLMLALYRCGRQADALDAYRDARSVLTETLGLEPGPDLRRLEQQILRQDSALDRTRLRSPFANAPLPAPASRLIGREGD